MATVIKDLLLKCFLFKGLPVKAIEDIRAIGAVREFGSREIIFMEGDPAEGFHMVVEGRVKIFKLSSEGREQILHVFGMGEPFGEAAVFAKSKFPANAMAMEKTETFYIPRDNFVLLLQQDPSLAINLLAILSRRLMNFAGMIGDLSLKEVPGRLATYLLILRDRQNATGSVTLDMPKTQLASLLGTIPETLSRIFARMQKQEILIVQGPEIKFLDIDTLVEISGIISQENHLHME
jgi:CRP/FNR family transcriptional regulator